MKIGPHPGMLGLKQFAHRSDRDDLAVRECCDAVADGIQAGEIMGDHEHRQPQRFLQCLDQDIEIARRDRVQTRCRLCLQNALKACMRIPMPTIDKEHRWIRDKLDTNRDSLAFASYMLRIATCNNWAVVEDQKFHA